MSDSEAKTGATGGLRRVVGWIVLGIAATINVGVAAVGLSAWISGPIDPSRLGASRIVFSFYAVLGAISILALIGRWRKSSGCLGRGFYSISIVWAGLLCGFVTLGMIFHWAV